MIVCHGRRSHQGISSWILVENRHIRRDEADRSIGRGCLLKIRKNNNKIVLRKSNCIRVKIQNVN